MSLVEVLVAILLLGIILSASASSLIQFSRTAADNERRVQATALLNRLHEEMQALPWGDAVLYDDELQDLLDTFEDETEGGEWTGTSALEGLQYDGTAWYFEGEEVVVLPGPGTDGRRTAVPTVHEPDGIVVDGRDYEVVRLITWNQRDPEIKRFTTIVRWQVLDRMYEERFESTRAATANEAGDPTRPRVIQFQVGPSPTPLEADGPDQDTNVQPLDIVVRFSSPVDRAEVRFYSVESLPVNEGDPPVLALRSTGDLTVDITQDGGNVGFSGTIGANAYVFPTGSRTFQVIGYLGVDEFTGTTSVEFTGGSVPAVSDPDEDGNVEPVPDPEEPTDPGDQGDPPAEDVSFGSVTVSPAAVCTDKDDLFVSNVTVEVNVAGMTPDDYVVTVTYQVPGNETRTEALEPVGDPATISSAGHTFRRVFVAGQSHGFVLTNNQSHTTFFTVTASRSSDGQSAGPTQSTSALMVTKRNNPGPSCP
jgi:type II secretory pathway pseudopilin PulG